MLAHASRSPRRTGGTVIRAREEFAQQTPESRQSIGAIRLKGDGTGIYFDVSAVEIAAIC